MLFFGFANQKSFENNPVNNAEFLTITCIHYDTTYGPQPPLAGDRVFA